MHPVIAYPGTEGSFSQAAAMRAFEGSELQSYPTFREVAQAVVEHKADYGLLPVENSSAGAVLATYKLLEALPLTIAAEVMEPVRHQLLGLPGADLKSIRRISSHPQAIAQCDRFLAGLTGVTIVPSENTAISAREVAEKKDPTMAAIASRQAAARFGLQVLAEDIQTSRNNVTRFYVIACGREPLGVPDKATVIFTVNNEVGALVRVLSIFAEHGLNMSRIESRPLPESAFYYFFSVDLEGDMDAAHLHRAMQAARPFTQQLRLLGTYPKATRPEED